MVDDIEKGEEFSNIFMDGAEEHLLFGFEQIASAVTTDRRTLVEELNQLRFLYLLVAFWYINMVITGNCLWKRCIFFLADVDTKEMSE